jgi:tRNA A58 N-methylase Trm61
VLEAGFAAGMVFVLVSVLYWSLRLGVSPMFTSPKVAKKVGDVVASSYCTKVGELGSGWGSLALYLAHRCPEKEVVGYEYSPIPYGVSVFLQKAFWVPNLHLVRRDFLKRTFEEGEVVVTYLYPEGVQALHEVLCKSNTSVTLISVAFAVDHVKPRSVCIAEDMFETPVYMYLYKPTPPSSSPMVS